VIHEGTTLAAAALYGLHLLAVWAERRGYIYYRERRGSSGALSSAVLEVQALLEPAKRHVLEEKKRDAVESEDSGGPPEAGGLPARRS
jgi:hypothetical protein